MTDPPIRLEVGRYYRSSDGRRFKVIAKEESRLGIIHYTAFDGASYSTRRHNGRVGYFRRHGDDLIEQIKPCHLTDPIADAIWDTITDTFNSKRKLENA